MSEPSILYYNLLNVRVPDLICYMLTIIFFGFLIRFCMSFLRAMERYLARQTKPADGRLREFRKLFFEGFIGIDKGNPTQSDFWQPFFIGVIELIGYPILMLSGAWTFIGAWITLKTLAQWKVWTEQRTVFNRFLIGNLLVIVASTFILRAGYLEIPNEYQYDLLNDVDGSFLNFLAIEDRPDR